MPLLNFTKEPGSSIEATINTPITLFWQIQYETCSQGSSCFQENLHIVFSNNSTLPIERVSASEFLFNAATTLIPGGPNDTTFSYANVRVIMYIDEYVHNNVASLICTATLLTPSTMRIFSTMDIEVINQALPTTANQPISLESTPEPPTCNSALVICSPALPLNLLCFCQLLLLYAIASCCT